MRDITVLAVPGKRSTETSPTQGATGMANQNESLQLNDADIAFLQNLLRNASAPLTTQELIDALRQRSGR
jgi:hypothetical protein